MIYKTLTLSLLTLTLSACVTLQRDMGTSGPTRYCKYSDGHVHTVHSSENCPPTLEDKDRDHGGRNGRGRERSKGFLTDEYRDGRSKVCVYDAPGRDSILRIPQDERCPRSIDF